MKRLTVTLACALMFGMLANPGFASARIASHQLVVVVTANHSVSSRPNGGQIALLRARRPITRARTVLPVLARVLDAVGASGCACGCPVGVSGSAAPPATGWISASNTKLETTPWHIVVSLKAREVIVYKYGRPLHVFLAVVGEASTPTPTGQYFVEEDVTLSNGQAGGPFALATSDRSNVLQEFDGGPGQIAIHGRENLGGRLGTARSRTAVSAWPTPLSRGSQFASEPARRSQSGSANLSPRFQVNPI